jgi:peptide/nickel transport system substrate-binding protein
VEEIQMRRAAIAVISVLLMLVSTASVMARAPETSVAREAHARPGAGASTGLDGAHRLVHSSYPARFEPGRAGGSATVGLLYGTENLNPYFAGPAVVNATQRGLVHITDDLRYLPVEAIHVPTVENGRVTQSASGSATVAWRLRAGLTWSDGIPLTCSDYHFTLEWLLNPGNDPSFKYPYLTRAGAWHFSSTGTLSPKDVNLRIGCPSSTEMTWAFREANPDFLSLLPVPLPEHYLSRFAVSATAEGDGYRAEQLAHVPVSGPFRFVSSKENRTELTRNDRFQDDLSGGPSYLARLTLLTEPDAAALTAAYRNHVIDLAIDLTQDDRSGLAGMDRLLVGATPQTERLVPNWSTRHCSDLQAKRGGACPMADPAVREAVALAIDRAAISRDVYKGMAWLTRNTILHREWYASSAALPGFDLAAARRTLSRDGWVMDRSRHVRFRDFNRDGIKDGNDYDAIALACTTDNRPDRMATLTLIAQQLRRVGIRLTVQAVPITVLFGTWSDTTADTSCNLAHGTYDLAEYAFYWYADQSAQFFPYYHSSQFEPGGLNDGRVNSRAVDAALVTASTSMDANAVFDAMASFQRSSANQIVDIPLYHSETVALIDPSLHNVNLDTASSPLWNVQDWWIGR